MPVSHFILIKMQKPDGFLELRKLLSKKTDFERVCINFSTNKIMNANEDDSK